MRAPPRVYTQAPQRNFPQPSSPASKRAPQSASGASFGWMRPASTSMNMSERRDLSACREWRTRTVINYVQPCDRQRCDAEAQWAREGRPSADGPCTSVLPCMHNEVFSQVYLFAVLFSISKKQGFRRRPSARQSPAWPRWCGQSVPAAGPPNATCGLSCSRNESKMLSFHSGVR